MKQGLNLVGKVVGVVAEAWNSNGKSGVNVTLGVAREYVDRFGAVESETVGVDVRGDKLQEYVRGHAEKFKGKVCCVNVRAMAFAGKSGPFVRLSMVSDSEIVPIVQPAPAARAAS